jgi:hypothetical protein
MVDRWRDTSRLQVYGQQDTLRVKTMKENFISVNPTGNKKNSVTRTNLNAIRETLMHFRVVIRWDFFLPELSPILV